MVDTILQYLQFNLSPKDIVPFPDLPPDIDNRAIYSYLKINYITNEVIEYHGKLNFIWYEQLDNNTDLWLDYLIGSGKLDNENLIEIELTGYGKWYLAEIRNYSKEGLIKGDIFPKEPLLIVPRVDYNSYN